jgi:malate/lactate dehydrogenase
MSFLAVIGAGELGGASTQALAALDCAREVRLIDPAADVAAGKALDIMQAAASEGYATRVIASGDERSAVGAKVIILADAVGQPSKEWQGEEGLALVRRLWNLVSSDGSVIVCAGAAQAALIGVAVRELRIDRRRILGSAAGAFESAARALVAPAFDGSGQDVGLTIVGAPPSGFVACWSHATVGGEALTGRLSAAQLAAVEARLPKLWPPAPYALASAAARACDAIVRGSRTDLTSFVVLDGEFNARGAVTALPVRLGATGIVGVREPELSAQERVRLDNALAERPPA